ncbi:hypothetical protein L6452_34776 [Arctium lappa]|uniref:Uncharacterized protein n=1 Tax=Arctium lappa TaxID=4217 RepID=A0ACB8YJE2_ARCLA|nr:hypothetical protein L6452_34776 [Arctium lappa]
MEGLRFEVCEDIESAVAVAVAVAMADIVCCVINSETPLVLGMWLKAGAHLDLVGSSAEKCRPVVVGGGGGGGRKKSTDERMKGIRVNLANEGDGGGGGDESCR